MMVQTITVYLVLSFIMVLFSYISKKKNSFKYTLIGLFIYSIIMGLRYGVGTDYFSYENIYNSYIELGNFSYSRLELGFRMLIQLFASLRLSYPFFLGVMAFLQLFFLFRGLKTFIYPYAAFTFMLGGEWLHFSNAIRQILAFCILVYSIKFLQKNSFIKYLICVVIASLFHNSAVLLLVIYPIFRTKKEWFSNNLFQIFLLLFAIFLMQVNIIGFFISMTEPLAIYLNYGNYTKLQGGILFDEVKLGLGFYVQFTINLLLIVYSSKVKNFFSSTWLTMAYDLYFIGVLWHYIFIDSLILNRINYYFYGFQFIIAAFTLYYLHKQKKIFCYILTTLYILLFIATMYRMESNTALYIFNWQKELYYLK